MAERRAFSSDPVDLGGYWGLSKSVCNGSVLSSFRAVKQEEGGLCPRKGIPCLGEMRRGMEPKAGLCGGHSKVTLAVVSHRAARGGDNSEGSLSEFYYHSNEDVERYFI